MRTTANLAPSSLMWRSRNCLLFCLLTLFLLLPPSLVFGQEVSGNDEVGAPFFLEHFRPQDYGHYHQNWSVVQDERGIVYVANNDGVLEYDGASWRLIKTETNTIVRSVALGRDGIVYVGTKGDFGYLSPDSTGTLRYVSLVDKVDLADREFSDVWGTHVTGAGVYFQTRARLFRWDGVAIKVWDDGRSFHTSFVVRDRFYVRAKGVGLLQVTDDSLHLAPGGEAFAERRVYMMEPYGEDRILIGTRQSGFFEYHEGTLTPFPTEADPILRDFDLYHGCVLPGGFYALATLGKGVLIIDKQGRLVQVLNKESGFPDDWINYVYVDAQGGLWAALNGAGVARVDVPSQLTMYDDRLGLDGNVHAIRRHQESLYIGTSTGLFKLERPEPGGKRTSHAVVEVLSGITTPDLFSADSILFAATHDGLFRIRNGEREPDVLMAQEMLYTLLESKRFPGQILIGKRGGLARLHHTPAGWETEDVYKGKAHPSDEIWSIAEEQNGTLWLKAADGTVLRLQFPDEEETLISERFTREDGLPEEIVGVEAIDGEVAFLSEQGIYRFDPEKERGATFYLDTSLLASGEAAPSPLRDFIQDDDGNVWMVYDDGIDIAIPQKEGAYRFESPPVLRFPKKSTLAIIYVEEDGIAWIGNGDELVRYDPSVEKTYDRPFS
ncbi:MAG: histidine kinase, partial [Bacteroidetes bacterium]|nr:histidine kinase [Bacteroidota bacterium]